MGHGKTRSGLEKTSLRCPTHRQTVTRYCYTCERFICEECNVECEKHTKAMLYYYVNELFKPQATTHMLMDCKTYGEAVCMMDHCEEMVRWASEQVTRAFEAIKEKTAGQEDAATIASLSLDALMGLALLNRRRGMAMRLVGQLQIPGGK